MSRNPMSRSIRNLAAVLIAACGLGVAVADEPAPADNPQAHGGRHHDPAWAACKQQADEQKLQPGDARRDFMKTCLKSAKSASPPSP